MMLKVGDKVTNPKCPEWGIGKVLALRNANKADVFFLGVGKKTIMTHIVDLSVLTDASHHPILDANGFVERAQSDEEYRDLDTALAIFLKLFPEGFEDAYYLDEERNYKVATREKALELLGRDPMMALIQAEDYAEVARRALACIAKANLFFSIESAKASDALKNEAYHKQFALGLWDLLYDDADFESRFESYVSCLDEMGVANWPMATYFPFLIFPGQHCFLKPNATKQMAALIRAELNFQSHPNWRTYKCLLDMAIYLKDELTAKGLEPRDMIDVQSFMWRTQEKTD